MYFSGLKVNSSNYSNLVDMVYVSFRYIELTFCESINRFENFSAVKKVQDIEIKDRSVKTDSKLTFLPY